LEGQKRVKFGAINDIFRIWPRIFLDWSEISTSCERRLFRVFRVEPKKW